jgi:hypothetical protein
MLTSPFIVRGKKQVALFGFCVLLIGKLAKLKLKTFSSCPYFLFNFGHRQKAPNCLLQAPISKSNQFSDRFDRVVDQKDRF